MNKTIKTRSGERILKVFNYLNNSRLAILLYDNDEYCDDLTINLADFPVSDIDEGFISGDLNNTNEKGINYIDVFKKEGIIKESYGFIPYNYGSYEYVKFDLEKLKEYDPKGIDKFYKELDKNNTMDINI